MTSRTTDLVTIFRGIEQAGSINAYVDSQLRERGFMVERRATDNMSARELARYKKELKTEAAEKRTLYRDAWRAYKTENIVFLGEGVFWNDALDYDKWDLEQAEARAAENELPPLDKPKQLAEALELSIAELRWLVYHREVATKLHYCRFTIPKRDGSERAIWAPMPKLKQAQHWVLRNVVERLLVHGAAHGFLPGRSIMTNASQHTDSRMIIKLDIKDFFPTVTFPRVKGIFRHAGYREQIATLLALLCTESPRQMVVEDGRTFYVSLGPRCLPQGAPTSPGLSNVICLKMDRRIAGLAKRYGWRYTRYADDITLSMPASTKGDLNPATMIGLIKRIVADEGFRVHPEKTRIIRKGGRQSVTGLVVNGDAPPRVPRKTRRMLRAAMHNHANGKPLHEGETVSTLQGYIAYIGQSDPAQAKKLTEQLIQ
ncbi:reverse transcriptase family protein [Novipirellula sp. SH528]|uniref:reverse transcriptase family protein n=1 Tax=Novipirellula sp. SH528 TaxID=3454466 RepID=UPI003FA08DB0